MANKATEKTVSVAARHWMSNVPRRMEMPAGESLETLVDHMLETMREKGEADRAYVRHLRRRAACRVGMRLVPRERWASTFPKPGERIELLVKPGKGGGKNPLAQVLSVVVAVSTMIAAPYVGGLVAGSSWATAAAGATTSFSFGTIGGLSAMGAMAAYGAASLTGMAIMTLGNMAVNALCPPAQPRLANRPALDASPTYSLGGARNAANPYGFVPLVLGRHKVTPVLGAKNWTSVQGDKTYFNMLAVWGHADMTVRDIRIGDTPLSSFKGVEHVFHPSTTGGDLSLFGRSHTEEAVGASLGYDDYVARTYADTEAINFDISFPRGLAYIHNETGKPETYQVTVKVEYCEAGSGRWRDLLAPVAVSARQLRPLARNVEAAVPRGSYDVRMKLVDRYGFDTDWWKEQNLFAEAVWATRREVIARPAFASPVPLCVSELRIQASEQLSGVVDDLSAVCASVVPDWDGTAWTPRETNNPASLVRHCLTSAHGLAVPYGTDKLDDASLIAFHEECARRGWAYNFVCDTETSLWERLTQIAAAGRGAVTTDYEGRFGVIMDVGGKEPVQLFTPRNSWGFGMSRAFARAPHALRVKFVNEDNDYRQDEGFVYADGYDRTNASDIQEWDFPGATSWPQIWKMGRYYLASLRLRPITVTLSTDWEWRMCRRGDVVGVAHDVLMNTFGTARVAALIYRDAEGRERLVRDNDERPADAPAVGVVLDDTVVFSEPAPARYGIAVRTPGGRLIATALTPRYGEETDKLLFAEPITVAQTPRVGDLAAVSLLGEEYADYLVTQIAPGENMSAELTLVPHAPEIMLADAGAVPPWSPPLILDGLASGRALPVPAITLIKTDESVLIKAGNALLPQIGIWFSLGKGGPEDRRVNALARPSGCTDWSLRAEAPAAQGFVLISGPEEGETYDVAICLADERTGRRSEYAIAEKVRVLGKTLPPPNVENLRLSFDAPLGLRADWDPVKTSDVSHYLIAGDLSGRASDTTIALPPYGLTGEVTLSVVAVDTLGLVSAAPAFASATIEPPAAPVIASAELKAEGIAVRWDDAARTWPVERCLVRAGSASAAVSATSAVLPAPRDFAAGDVVTVQAVDIFGNASPVSEPVPVAVTPPLVPQARLSLNAEDGSVRVDWQDCGTVCPLRHYVITGAMSGTSTGTSLNLPAPKRAGGVTVQVTAVDVYGIESGRGQATLEILPPKNPVIRSILRNDGLYLAWDDCAASWPIRRYEIADEWTGETLASPAAIQLVAPRPAGTYRFGVTAVDAVGLMSSEVRVNVEVAGVSPVEPRVDVDGSDMVVSWPIPASSFPIDRYEIAAVDGTVLGSTKATDYRFPCPAAGTHGYRVRAVDVAGNAGDWGEASRTVAPPEAPTVSAAVEGEGVALRWTAGPSMLPVVAFDVVRQWDETRADGVIETHEEDYGRLDADALVVPALRAGEHVFMARAVDGAGNRSGWGTCDFGVTPPGRVAFVNCATVDNNVMLYWTAPDRVFFPIREYVFSEIDEDGRAMEIGRIDAQFASSFETRSGTYTYGVAPVDAGGNTGVTSTISMTVSQPPDFIFYHSLDSLFNGERTNMVLDGRGDMIGPVPDGESWSDNLRRMTSAAGKAVETWEDKIAAGFGTWLEPGLAEGSHVEVVDAGKLVPSTRIGVTVTSRPLAGNPSLACRVDVSADGRTWRTVAENAFNVYATQFRYARYTLSVRGGVAAISNVNYALDVKKRTDFGRAAVKATDNGEGFVSEQATPMLAGTWVPFNVDFIDVESLPKPNVVNDERLSAFTVFEDAENPRGFRVFVKDKNGNRADATVDWSAYGV